MKLLIEDDEGRKTTVPLVRDEITIGRQEGNTIRLTDRNVSRRHAKLVRRNGLVTLEDLNSYTGVKVNGDRIKGTVQISLGDIVQIGDYDLTLRSEEPDALGEPVEAKADDIEELGAGNEPTQQSKLPSLPSDRDTLPPGKLQAPAITASTAVISSNQVRATRPNRKVVDIAPEKAPKLVVTTTELAGREFACIRSELKIGRTDDNDISIDHRSLSRNHCKIYRENSGEWRVVDLESANGVKVNGETYAESGLKYGDQIELGHLHLRFLAPGQEAPPPAEIVTQPGDDPAPRKSKAPIFLGALVVIAGLGAAGWFALGMKGKPAEPPAVARPEPGRKVDPPPQEPPPEEAEEPAEPKAEPEVPPLDPAVVKLFEKGQELFKQGKFLQAEKMFARATDFQVEGAADWLARARAELEAEQSFKMAQAKIAANDLPAARVALDDIPEESSFAPRAKALRAQISESEKRPAAAPAKPKPGIDRAAVSSEAFDQGMKLFNDKKFEEAIPLFEKAIAADPGNARAHMYLGTCFAKTQQVDRGALQYEEFVRLAPNDPLAPKVVTLLKQYFASKPGTKPRYPLPP